MTESKDKLPEHEVDDSHDSIDMMNLEGWTKREHKNTPDNDTKDTGSNSQRIVEAELLIECTVEFEPDNSIVEKDWFAGQQESSRCQVNGLQSI